MQCAPTYFTANTYYSVASIRFYFHLLFSELLLFDNTECAISSSWVLTFCWRCIGAFVLSSDDCSMHSYRTWQWHQTIKTIESNKMKFVREYILIMMKGPTHDTHLSINKFPPQRVQRIQFEFDWIESGRRGMVDTVDSRHPSKHINSNEFSVRTTFSLFANWCDKEQTKYRQCCVNQYYSFHYFRFVWNSVESLVFCLL